MMTTSRRRSVGARHCSTSARKIGPFIGHRSRRGDHPVVAQSNKQADGLPMARSDPVALLPEPTAIPRAPPTATCSRRSALLWLPVSRQRCNHLTGEIKRNVLRNRRWFLRYGGAAVPFIFVGLRAQGAERAGTVEDIVTGRARISVPIVLGRLSRRPLQASRRLRHLFKTGSISNKDRTFCNSNNTVALPIAKTPVHALARAPHHVSQLPLAVTNDERLSWRKGAVQVQKSQHRLR
jgi:hypothetical protein